MNKIILKNGLFGGLIVAASLVIITLYMKANPEKVVNMFFGFVSMLLAFLFAIKGIKQQRSANNGIISFGKAFKTSFWITFSIATIYVIVWLLIYYNFFPNFAEHYTDMAIKNASPADVVQVTKDMNTFKAMYKNPLMVVVLTYAEILPLGLIFSLLSAILIKKK